MLPGVVAKVVPEGAFRLGCLAGNRAFDDEVGVGVDRRSARPPDHRDAVAGQCAGEGEFREPLGQRHHRRDRHGRGATDKNGDLQRLMPGQGGGMVYPNAPVNLIVQADLLVGLIGISAELHPVHAQV